MEAPTPNPTTSGRVPRCQVPGARCRCRVQVPATLHLGTPAPWHPGTMAPLDPAPWHLAPWHLAPLKLIWLARHLHWQLQACRSVSIGGSCDRRRSQWTHPSRPRPVRYGRAWNGLQPHHQVDAPWPPYCRATRTAVGRTRSRPRPFLGRRRQTSGAGPLGPISGDRDQARRLQSRLHGAGSEEARMECEVSTRGRHRDHRVPAPLGHRISSAADLSDPGLEGGEGDITQPAVAGAPSREEAGPERAQRR